MSILNKKTVGSEITRRASTISVPELSGDPNSLTDARILNAVNGDWYIPADAPNTRWQKTNFENNIWFEFTAGIVDVKDVAISSSDGDPRFLAEKIIGTHGTQASNLGDDLVSIDSRRTALIYG